MQASDGTFGRLCIAENVIAAPDSFGGISFYEREFGRDGTDGAGCGTGKSGGIVDTRGYGEYQRNPKETPTALDNTEMALCAIENLAKKIPVTSYVFPPVDLMKKPKAKQDADE